MQIMYFHHDDVGQISSSRLRYQSGQDSQQQRA